MSEPDAAIDLTESVSQLRNFPSNYLTPGQEERRHELCEAAIAYAKMGWRVIPVRWITSEGVCSCSRGADCASPAKHPVHPGWPDVATCDPAEVASWWREPPEGIAEEWFPRSNIGIATGRASKIFALDVDPDHGGDATLAALQAQHGELPPTRVHRTGSGGCHYFFVYPYCPIGNSAGTYLGDGLDIRAEHGQAVAPPSISLKGGYEVLRDAPVAEAPDWLLDRLRDRRARARRLPRRASHRPGGKPVTGLPRKGAARAQLQGLLVTVIKAEEGTRNNILHWAACRAGEMVAVGLMGEDAAMVVLAEAADQGGQPSGQAADTIRSGLRKGMSS